MSDMVILKVSMDGDAISVRTDKDCLREEIFEGKPIIELHLAGWRNAKEDFERLRETKAHTLLAQAETYQQLLNRIEQ
jgi:hypothetical protein